jgi:microcompartment protein CcmL/EutN
MKALGMIEVRGFLGAVSVADAALKAADVTLLKAEIISGGLTTVELIGDVAAVTAAVEVGTKIAEDLNCLIAHHVISRVDSQTEVVLSAAELELPEKEMPVAEEVIETAPQPSVMIDQEAEMSETAPIAVDRIAELKSKRVVDLRKQAYKMNLTNLKKSEIKFANKEVLIAAIMAEIERSEDDWN